MSFDDFEPQSALGKAMKKRLNKKSAVSSLADTPASRASLETLTALTPSGAARPQERQSDRQVAAYSNAEPQSALGKAMKDQIELKKKALSPAGSLPGSSDAGSSAARPGYSTGRPQESQQFTPDPHAVDKFRGMHDYFVRNKLFLTDTCDIKFNCYKTNKVTKNGSIKAVRSRESYSSPILFQLLTTIGFNWRGTKRNNTLLAQGDPGLGKTLLAELCGQYIFHETPEQIAEATIQGHPQQTAETMIAQYDLPSLMKGQKKVLKSPWVTGKAHNVDEIGRLPEDMMGILLRMLDDGRMKHCDEVIEMEEGMMTGTMNLDSASGPLYPAAKDRFQVSVPYKSLNPTFLPAMIAEGKKSKRPLDIPEEMYIDRNTILTARDEIRRVQFDKNAVRKLVHFIAQIDGCEKAGDTLEAKTKSNAQNRKPSEGLCVGCHYKDNICSYFDNSVSVRAFEAVISYAAGLAWFRKKGTVEEDDLVEVLARVWRHRGVKTQKAVEKNAVWDNDEISLTKGCWSQASAKFIHYQNTIPEFNNMLDDLDNPHELVYGKSGGNVQETIKRLDTYFDSVIQNMDDVSAFAYANSLNFVLEQLEKNDSHSHGNN